uniref:Protein YIPF n=1 Tax=Ditylenchus dipsaci TaxID=166011 RepID=A0A915EEP2_9BILA
MNFSSFFQALCVIGYCLLPSVFAALMCKVVGLLIYQHTSLLLLRLLLAAFGFMWSTYASMSFLAGTQPENRRLLGFYPVILFLFRGFLACALQFLGYERKLFAGL